MARLDIIKPVPNPGGEAAIATEARRLKTLAAAGLRVPAVLAQQADGLLISDLGESGRATVVLQERLDQAAAAGPAALLAVWREGLAAIAAGKYLPPGWAAALLLAGAAYGLLGAWQARAGLQKQEQIEEA